MFPRAWGPSDVRCPEYATTRRPPSHRYHRFFFPSLPLSFSILSRISLVPLACSLFFPLPYPSRTLFFRISRETGSSRSSSAAFEQLPDPSRDFIRAMRRKEFKSTKRIYVYTNKYDIYINLFINQDTRYIWFM